MGKRFRRFDEFVVIEFAADLDMQTETGSVVFHSGGPEYINDNFPLIDKMEKCTVKRIPAGSDMVEKEEEQVKAEEVEAFPAKMEQPGRAKLVRRIGGPFVASDTDASALMAPENETVVAAVFLLALVLICLIRGGRKNEAKTQ